MILIGQKLHSLTLTLMKLLPSSPGNDNQQHSVPSLLQYIATIKAVHTGANASKAPGDDAGGLEAIVCLAKWARVILIINLWV